MSTTSNSRWFISLLVTLRATVAGCVPAPAGLTVQFTFEEPLFRAANALLVPGYRGLALRLDGNAQFAGLPTPSAANAGSSDFSVELWFRSSEKRTRNLVDKRDGGPKGYTLFLDQGGFPGFQVAEGAALSVVIDRSQSLADNRWHHLAAVARRLPRAPAELYVDGVRRQVIGRPVPLDDLDTEVPLWFGRHHSNSIVPRDNIYYRGEIDEFAFFRRALSAHEVRSIYQAGRFGKCR